MNTPNAQRSVAFYIFRTFTWVRCWCHWSHFAMHRTWRIRNWCISLSRRLYSKSKKCINVILIFMINRHHHKQHTRTRTVHTHTHTRLTALCPGLPGWAGTRKTKPIWILLKQETVVVVSLIITLSTAKQHQFCRLKLYKIKHNVSLNYVHT